MIINARDLVLNPGKPPKHTRPPETPNPMLVWIDAGDCLVPFEIALTDKFKRAQQGVGFASLIVDGCTVKNTTGIAPSVLVAYGDANARALAQCGLAGRVAQLHNK